MNKTKFYLLLIAALTVLNGIMLFLHFIPPLKQNGPKNIIIKKLQFDDQQIKKYDILVTAHRVRTRVNEAQINNLKNSLYQELTQVISDSSEIDNLVHGIAELQKKAEIINFRHFQDIKKLCKPDQLPYFKKLVGELSQLFSDTRPPLKK